ncbi:MAG: hypothetical protein IKY82_07820 [Alistipes sp.]|nr:hypothetical protein [Alistipes sp.]
MRKILTILSLLLSLPLMASNNSDAVALLGRLSKYVGQLGNYEVQFDMNAGEYSTRGYFRVAGDLYYISVGDAEVYSDGKVRYEVDNQHEEVYIDEVDTKSRNVLDNPTRCFDFAGTDYLSEVVRRDSGAATIKLVSKDKSVEGEIYLTIKESTAEPLAIEYRLYDDRFNVKVCSIAKSKTSPAKFDRSRYRDYEIIDFR